MCSAFLGSLDDEAPGWEQRAGQGSACSAPGARRGRIVYGLLGRGFARSTSLNRSRDKAEGARGRVRGGRAALRHWPISRRGLGQADLLVNATSLGMARACRRWTLDLAALKASALVCDIVYVPLETDLVKAARSTGHRAVGGLGMLLHQAVPGFRNGSTAHRHARVAGPAGSGRRPSWAEDLRSRAPWP